jgi:hypothetical protein
VCVLSQRASGWKTVAMRLAVLLGYSPYGAVTLFEKFAKLDKEYIIQAQSPEEELSELAIQSLEGYLRSQPQPSERLAQANALIAQEGWQDRKAKKRFAWNMKPTMGIT